MKIKMKELNIDKKFKEFMIIDRIHPNSPRFGHQWVFKFPNGYGASLITGGSGTYGQYEIGVVKFHTEEGDSFNLTYSTSVTDDVMGHLDIKGIEKKLKKIKKLKKRKFK